MSKRSAQRARGRARWERRREAVRLERRAAAWAKYPHLAVSETFVGKPRIICTLPYGAIRAWRKAGLLYRPPSLRGKRRQTRRYRERQL